MKNIFQTLMLKKSHFLSLLILVSADAYCQQDPLYGLWLNNPLVVNPAYTGINNNLTLFTTYRNQWGGFDGSPVTLNAGGHISLLKNKIGIGAMVVNDKIGESTNTQFTASFAYKLTLNTGTTLSFGMQGGFINYKTDPSRVTLQDVTDPLFMPLSEMTPNLGAGVILKGDKFLVGLSVPRLINTSFDTGGQKINVYQQHYYLMTSYLFYLSERLIFKPSALLKSVTAAPLSVDLNANLIIHSKYGAGIYTRNFNAYGLLAQFDFLEKFRIAYAMEVPTNQSVGTSYITHELMLSIRTGALRFHERPISNF